MHRHNYNKQTLNFAKNLRSDMTIFEEKLWYHLRARRFCDLKFRRQVPIGKYIADFVCKEKHLIIELDGSGHLLKEQLEHDKLRDQYFEQLGYKIVRIYNNALNEDISSVLEKIKNNLAP